MEVAQNTIKEGDSKRELAERTPTERENGTTNQDKIRECILDCTLLEGDNDGNFVDHYGRRITLKGINVDGAMKLPCVPNMRSIDGDASDENSFFWEGDQVSFVGRPFPIEEAETHFQRIKSWGFNTIRYLVTWEAIEHESPGKYDEKFIDYTIKMLKVIHKVGGLYVFLEIHQDVWSRFCGGSGAPLWTLYAMGFQPRRFYLGEAAIFHNEGRFKKKDKDSLYDKMLWTSNYNRLAAKTMFTAFFGGREFFPRCVINGENIQDYLQGTYLNCIRFFWERITEGVSEMIASGSLLGFELLNEPNPGFIGHERLDVVPDLQHLRVGTTPTSFQCMKLGMGFACEVDSYRISVMGPQKYETKLVDPKGKRAWLLPEEAIEIDRKYGWSRDSEWTIGECIYSLHGIWSYRKSIAASELEQMTAAQRLNTSDFACKLNTPYYFKEIQPIHIVRDKSINQFDFEYFVNNNFVEHFLRFKHIIRDISPTSFVLMQPPVLKVPPDLINDSRGLIDKKTVYCPHYYDGMSLMFKTWNTKYNVDTFGIMRDQYYRPFLALVIGSRAIKNSFKQQFLQMKEECYSRLGKIPILMSETGMPYDMDDKQAYKDGKFISQTYAQDALANGLEKLGLSHTYWCYTSINNHELGDCWNDEDFSLWSSDDKVDHFVNDVANDKSLFEVFRYRENASKLKNKPQKVTSPLTPGIDSKIMKNQKSYTVTSIKSNVIENNVLSQDFDEANNSITGSMDQDSLEWRQFNAGRSNSSTYDNMVAREVKKQYRKKCYASPGGTRAFSAVIRPYVVATHGDVISSEFDLKSVKFCLKLKFPRQFSELLPTIIFVPKVHFPSLKLDDVVLSSGIIKYNKKLECLEWYHAENRGTSEEEIISIQGVFDSSDAYLRLSCVGLGFTDDKCNIS